MNEETTIEKPAGNCWLFHKWSRWTQYKQPIMKLYKDKVVTEAAFDLRQKRTCLRCGMVQDIYIC